MKDLRPRPKSRVRNVRPESVADLMVAGASYAGWEDFNGRQNRFYLLNVNRVIGALRITTSNFDKWTLQARDVILNETTWSEQFLGDYSASKTQIYPGKITQAKLFDKAATLLVAFELAAHERLATYDVYGHLKILPAFYYLSGLTKNSWDTFKLGYDRMASHEKEYRAGLLGLSTAPDIYALWNALLPQAQSQQLVQQMTTGYCVTREVAESLQRLAEIIQGNRNLFGEVTTAGSNLYEHKLGTKAAAPAFVPPR